MKLKPVEFHHTKYGPELLIDVAWVHDMPAFITDRPHTLAFFDIMLVTRGGGALGLDDERHAVRPGAVFFTKPGVVRDWRVTQLDGVCLFFPASFLEDFFTDAAFLERLPFFAAGAPTSAMYLRGRRSARLESRLAAMRRELRSLRGDSSHLLRARLYEILIMLGRWYAARQEPAQPRIAHPTIARFRKLIEQHVTARHDVAFYAERLGVTAGHLNAICRQALDANAKSLVAEALALRARRLLRYSDRSVADIAGALGFEDPSYFSRFIRRQTGHTPSSLRASAAGR